MLAFAPLRFSFPFMCLQDRVWCLSRPRGQVGTLARSVKHKLRIQSQRDTEIHRSATDVKVNTLVAAQPRRQERGRGGGERRTSSQIRSQSSDKGTRKGATSPINLNRCPRAKSCCRLAWDAAVCVRLLPSYYAPAQPETQDPQRDLLGIAAVWVPKV